MASVAAIEERLTSLWETPKSLYGWFATVDHKELGIRYLVTAFVFLLIGGVEALIMRIQLSYSNLAVMSPETYNQIFTMHGTTMIFWYASPILSGFAVYLVPLMIGARDMAFPRLNAFLLDLSALRRASVDCSLSRAGAYYYLGSNNDRWANENAPHLHYPLILLAILISSSFVLHWGEQQVKKLHLRAGEIALWITVVLGSIFLAIQGFECPATGPISRPTATATGPSSTPSPACTPRMSLWVFCC